MGNGGRGIYVERGEMWRKKEDSQRREYLLFVNSRPFLLLEEKNRGDFYYLIIYSIVLDSSCFPFLFSYLSSGGIGQVRDAIKGNAML